MVFLVETVNRTLAWVFRLLLWPLSGRDPLWAILLVSVLGGLLMLWGFALTSNQEGIRASKDRVRGNLFGVRLFQHDVAVVLKLQTAIFRDTLAYLKHSLAPVAFLLIPFLLILIQMNLFFSYRPLRVGESSIVTAQLNGNSVMDAQLELEPSPAFTLESPAVRVPAKNEVSWRIRAEKGGLPEIVIAVDGERVRKDLTVGGLWGSVSPVRTSSFLDLLLYSGETSLSSQERVRSINLAYAPLPVSVFGFETDWLVLFLVVSILVAFALKGWAGVEL